MGMFPLLKRKCLFRTEHQPVPANHREIGERGGESDYHPGHAIGEVRILNLVEQRHNGNDNRDYGSGNTERTPIGPGNTGVMPAQDDE